MDKNGWVTVDFMVAFMIILLTITSIIAIISDRVETVNSVQEIVEAKILEENIVGIIEAVYSGGPGCSYILKMPSKIRNKSYSITINSSGVYIFFGNNIGTEFINPIRITEGKHSNILLEPDKTYNISNTKFRDNNNLFNFSNFVNCIY